MVTISELAPLLPRPPPPSRTAQRQRVRVKAKLEEESVFGGEGEGEAKLRGEFQRGEGVGSPYVGRRNLEGVNEPKERG